MSSFSVDTLLDVPISVWYCLCQKLIYIARNPKDVVVSYFNFVKMSTQAGYTGNFDDFAELFIEGKGKYNAKQLDIICWLELLNKINLICIQVPYGPWWTHLNEYLSMMKNVHIICYEDLQTVRQLFELLDRPISQSNTCICVCVCVQGTTWDN